MWAGESRTSNELPGSTRAKRKHVFSLRAAGYRGVGRTMPIAGLNPQFHMSQERKTGARSA